MEAMESRTLLSAVAQPMLIVNAQASGSSTIQGYTPSQIASAYGFNQIALAGGVKGDGSGQTIAIVDAYNDPNIAADLATFDAAFGLSAPPSLTIESQTGSTSKLPATDSGWAQEISMDVEWAHAIAPGASILLVEANSASYNDLMTAVSEASRGLGVTVVSMSWGGSEFNGETSYDSFFTTPAGHKGVTFVASSGDQGAAYGPSYPATSPNVLAVGGTTLNINSSSQYVSETAWSGSTGGYSSFEKEPGYQGFVTPDLSGNVRTSPDVSYNADPNAGFVVYDSLSSGGQSGWMEFGGTSAGAPQWAALIAIANQGRKDAGEAVLSKTRTTAQILYSLYSSSTTYDVAFHDVTTDSSGSFYYQAGSGYDLVTGLGSPQASVVVAALVSGANSEAVQAAANAAVASGAANAAIELHPPAAVLAARQLPSSFVERGMASLLTATVLSGNTLITASNPPIEKPATVGISPAIGPKGVMQFSELRIEAWNNVSDADAAPVQRIGTLYQTNATAVTNPPAMSASLSAASLAIVPEQTNDANADSHSHFWNAAAALVGVGLIVRGFSTKKQKEFHGSFNAVPRRGNTV
jgi:subtilase family serine protease